MSTTATRAAAAYRSHNPTWLRAGARRAKRSDSVPRRTFATKSSLNACAWKNPRSTRPSPRHDSTVAWQAAHFPRWTSTRAFSEAESSRSRNRDSKGAKLEQLISVAPSLLELRSDHRADAIELLSDGGDGHSQQSRDFLVRQIVDMLHHEDLAIVGAQGVERLKQLVLGDATGLQLLRRRLNRLA